MNSHLKDILKKAAAGKGIEWKDYLNDSVRAIERELDRETMTIDEALAEVEKRFPRQFDRHDFEAMRKALR